MSRCYFKIGRKGFAALAAFVLGLVIAKFVVSSTSGDSLARWFLAGVVVLAACLYAVDFVIEMLEQIGVLLV